MQPADPVPPLDRTTYPAWRDGILAAEASGAAQPGDPRSYPGYPSVNLPRPGRRWWPPLDRVLAARRSAIALDARQPSARQLARLLAGAHGITGPHAAGPTPSAGGLQALELYLAVLAPGWLAGGAWHYDRVGHRLAQVAAGGSRADWCACVPSLERFAGGALLWVLVGDGARERAKYGERAPRFLLLEAGHLMQNLCLLSASVGLATTPLGGFFERDVARRLLLPPADEVLYLGVCGSPAARS